MLAKAKACSIKISPYKLRPIIDAIRGKRLDMAFDWLHSNPCAKVVPVFKVISSAWSNLQVKEPSLSKAEDVFIVIAKVDQGPTTKYSTPGSMGRGVVRRRRFSHIEVHLGKVEGACRGTKS
jgi:large subunit ribosomal protein L22